MPDLTQQAVDDQFARDATARLTYQATRRNKVTFYYSYNMACHCHFLVGPALAGSPSTSDGSVFLRIPNRVYQATWSSPVTNSTGCRRRSSTMGPRRWRSTACVQTWESLVRTNGR